MVYFPDLHANLQIHNVFHKSFFYDNKLQVDEKILKSLLFKLVFDPEDQKTDGKAIFLLQIESNLFNPLVLYYKVIWKKYIKVT